MVEIVKKQDRNRSLTLCRITASGRARYIEYLSTLEQVVRDAAKGTKETLTTGTVHGMTPARA